MNLTEKINQLPEDKKRKFIELLKEKGLEYGIYPLANNQKGMWSVYRMDAEKENPYYNPSFKIEFRDNIRPDKLKKAVEKLMENQDILNFKYLEIEGMPYQYKDKDGVLPYEEVIIEADSREKALQRFMAEETRFYLTNFNLFYEYPIKFKMIQIDKDYMVLLVLVHHIVSDGWSDGLILRMLIDGYEGKTVDRPKYQYTDYIIHEKSGAMQKKLNNNLLHWKEKLEQSSSFLDITTVFDRGQPGEYRSKEVVFPFKKETAVELKKIVKETKSNLHAILLALFTHLMNRYTEKEMINVGTTLANRDNVNYVDLIGDFASVIILPIECDDGLTVDQALVKTTDLLLDSMEHSDVILSELIENTSFNRIEHVHPLYQVIFGVHTKQLLSGCREGEEFPAGDSRVRIKMTGNNNNNDFKLDFCFIIQDYGDELGLQIQYSTKLFTYERIQHLAKAYIHLVEEALKNRGRRLKDCALIDADEMNWKESRVAYKPRKLLHQLRVNHQIKEIACVDGGEIAILDSNYYSLPTGFRGDLYYKMEGIWRFTGEKAILTEDLSLIICPEKSRIVEYKNYILDLVEINNELKASDKFTSAELYINKDNYLIFEYCSSDFCRLDELKDWIGVHPALTVLCRQEIDRNSVVPIARISDRLLSSTMIKELQVSYENGIWNIIFTTNTNAKLDEKIIRRLQDEFGSHNILYKYCNGSRIESEQINTYETYSQRTQSSTEQKIFNIWEDVLGSEKRFGIHDKFFEVGGSSIKIIRVLDALNKEFHSKINIADLFNYNTIFQLAELIDQSSHGVTENTLEGIKF